MKTTAINSELAPNPSGGYSQAILRQWRLDYNKQRPHSMMGNKTPAEVAEELRNQ